MFSKNLSDYRNKELRHMQIQLEEEIKRREIIQEYKAIEREIAKQGFSICIDIDISTLEQYYFCDINIPVELTSKTRSPYSSDEKYQITGINVNQMTGYLSIFEYFMDSMGFSKNTPFKIVGEPEYGESLITAEGEASCKFGYLLYTDKDVYGHGVNITNKQHLLFIKNKDKYRYYVNEKGYKLINKKKIPVNIDFITKISSLKKFENKDVKSINILLRKNELYNFKFYKEKSIDKHHKSLLNIVPINY